MDVNQLNFVAQELRRKGNEIWHEYDAYPPAELLHYAPPSGVRGILTLRQIWCTDVLHVTDPREGDHGLAVIRSVVRRRRRSVDRPFADIILKSTSLFGLKETWTEYIACFCSSGEQPYMWRDYAGGGDGCALVFDYSILMAGCDGGKQSSLFRVLYDKKKQVRVVEQILDCAIYLRRQLEVPLSQREQYWKQLVMPHLLACAIRFKDPNFCHEQEFRLCAADPQGLLTTFEVGGKRRVSLDIETSALRKVIRGKSGGGLSVAQIRNLLNEHGFREDVPIVESALAD